jgi:hypothetical protein
VHDRELKGLVAAMKPEAKAKFSEVLDIVKSKELWRTAKCLVELSAPAMNLLRLADSDIPGTGKVYHELFKTSKILEPNLKPADYAYIPTATHEAISAKWLNLLKTPKWRHQFTLTQTPKWWHQFAMLTNSRCLLGIMKMLR